MKAFEFAGSELWCVLWNNVGIGMFFILKPTCQVPMDEVLICFVLHSGFQVM